MTVVAQRHNPPGPLLRDIPLLGAKAKLVVAFGDAEELGYTASKGR